MSGKKNDEKAKSATGREDGAAELLPSRRGVIKAIAWGTPAIAIVTLSSNSLAQAASPPVGTTASPTTPFPTTPFPTTTNTTTFAPPTTA